MKIALYGRSISKEHVPFLIDLLKMLTENDMEVTIHKGYLAHLNVRNYLTDSYKVFEDYNDLKDNFDYLFSIGGDGTLLDTVGLVRNSNLPVMGINTGRLGFLSSTSTSSIKKALQAIKKGTIEIDSRTLLNVSCNKPLFGEQHSALNEVSFQKIDASQMVVVHAYINGKFLNSYWADGLIISTPTGSTAYNLSCGGPIIYPQSGNFVITPVAAHNLNVIPIIVSDENKISFEIEGRSKKFACTMDSQTATIDSSYRVTLKKEAFKFNLVRLPENDFLNAIRTKLNWGLDKRN